MQELRSSAKCVFNQAPRTILVTNELTTVRVNVEASDVTATGHNSPSGFGLERGQVTGTNAPVHQRLSAQVDDFRR